MTSRVRTHTGARKRIKKTSLIFLKIENGVLSPRQAKNVIILVRLSLIRKNFRG